VLTVHRPETEARGCRTGGRATRKGASRDACATAARGPAPSAAPSTAPPGPGSRESATARTGSVPASAAGDRLAEGLPRSSRSSRAAAIHSTPAGSKVQHSAARQPLKITRANALSPTQAPERAAAPPAGGRRCPQGVERSQGVLGQGLVVG